MKKFNFNKIHPVIPENQRFQTKTKEEKIFKRFKREDCIFKPGYNGVHFIGIGGIGVSALARLFLTRGIKVSGSDISDSEIIFDLRKMGANIFLGHKEENLEDDTELVIYSPAVPHNNPEFQKARKLNIVLKSYPEALGAVMSEFKETIAVSGTNGKTTTTSLSGLILENAGFDPTVIVGSKLKNWNGNLRVGASDYFLTEACEYKRAMLNLNPKIIVLTNIEEDHLDYYKDLDDIKSSFLEYVMKLPSYGTLIFNQDDEASREISELCKIKKFSYSVFENSAANLTTKNILQESGRQSFNLVFNGKDLGKFEMFVPGLFNIYNALAASSLALSLGIDSAKIRETLKDFRGAWRRFEIIGEKNGAIIISDYAHHPTAVRETIKGAKNFYPDKRILVVFQPHHQDRTKKLFNDFVESFYGADHVILSEIYEVAGREKNEEKISSLDLAKAMQQNGFQNVSFAENIFKAKEIVEKKLRDFDVVLIMGAGDIYKIANEITAPDERP